MEGTGETGFLGLTIPGKVGPLEKKEEMSMKRTIAICIVLLLVIGLLAATASIALASPAPAPGDGMITTLLPNATGILIGLGLVAMALIIASIGYAHRKPPYKSNCVNDDTGASGRGSPPDINRENTPGDLINIGHWRHGHSHTRYLPARSSPASAA